MATKLGLAAVLSLFLLPVMSADAWLVEQTEPAPGAGVAEAVVVPFHWEPDVDMFEIHKYFLLDKYPLVLKFTRQPGDKDVIEIVDEIILNLFEAEKLSWQDFHVALDGGLNPVSFVAPDLATAWQCTGGQTRLDGVPDIATATHISWATDDPSQYVPYGSFADAPLNQLVLRGLVIDVSVLEAGESFFLKQWPTTPEPGALALLCLGALAWARKRPRS